MSQRFKDRLAVSGSLLILVPLATGLVLSVNISTAAAQTVQAAQAQPTTDAPIQTAQAQTAPVDQSSNSTASPESELQEVVVTARLRKEDVEKVPEAIVPLGGDLLQQQGITNFTDLQGFAPSLEMSTAYVKDFTTVFLRGFAASAYFAEVPAQPVPLYDIDNIQILYGPQGTLFGYTALGGAVLYQPVHPNLSQYQAGIDVMLGNLDLTNINGYVNVPLVKDQLALRISFERDHTDGYTAVEGTSVKEDSNDNESARIALEFKPQALDGKFDNYAFIQFLHEGDTPTSRVVSGYDELSPAFQLTGTTPTGIAEPGPYPATFFNYLCTPTNLAASWPAGTTQAQCAAQHLNLIGQYAQQVYSAIALAQATNNREIPASIENAPLSTDVDNIIIEDIANYEAFHWNGFLGGGNITFHNIFSFLWYRNYVQNGTVGAFDYYAGSTYAHDIIPTPNTLINPNGLNPMNGFGTPSAGAYLTDYTDEFQIHGDLDHGMFTWVTGVYAAGYPASPSTATGDNNIPISFDGAYNANEGPFPADAYGNGYWASYWAEYTQGTLDFGAFWSALKGLHITGGVRYSQNLVKSNTYGVLANYAEPGNFFPSTVPTQTRTVSDPINWSASIDYTTDVYEVYFNTAYIVVPGFANAVPASGASSIPGYVPFAAPENLRDFEFGVKYKIDVGGVRGYVNLDAYRMELTQVQIPLTIFNTSTAGYFTFFGNPANETKEGIELASEVFPTPALDIAVNGAYTHAFYTDYFATDPEGYLKAYSATNPLCVQDVNNTCVLNFNNTPVALAPKLMLSLRARYTYKLQGNLGAVVPGVTVIYQSNMFFTPAAPLEREEELLGPQIGPAEAQSAYAVVNARLEWQKPFGANITAALFVNNMFNKTYADNIIDTLFAIGVVTKNFAPPRIFGLELTSKW